MTVRVASIETWGTDVIIYGCIYTYIYVCVCILFTHKAHIYVCVCACVFVDMNHTRTLAHIYIQYICIYICCIGRETMRQQT